MAAGRIRGGEGSEHRGTSGNSTGGPDRTWTESGLQKSSSNGSRSWSFVTVTVLQFQETQGGCGAWCTKPSSGLVVLLSVLFPVVAAAVHSAAGRV